MRWWTGELMTIQVLWFNSTILEKSFKARGTPCLSLTLMSWHQAMMSSLGLVVSHVECRWGVKGFAYSFRLIQNQSQVLLVIMFPCNSSKAPATYSSSYFIKVSGQSLCLCWCYCVKQWEATTHERPKLVFAMEGMLATMRVKSSLWIWMF